MDVREVFDQEEIFALLQKTRQPRRGKILQILEKAEEKKGLELEEVASLLNVGDWALIEGAMFKSAGKIKKEIYGGRLVLFAPLYVSNFCANNCVYCGFRFGGFSPRRKLTLKEVEEQTKILIGMGHKRLLVELGEHWAANSIEYVVDVIKTIYSAKLGRGEIRRVNVNVAATTVKNYRKLKAAGIGTYQLFQETYHRQTYKKLHDGPKADFERQLFAHDRAIEAGIDDIGLGVLFGLYDYKFDVMALISHAQYLDRKFGIGPHTFSMPRFQPAERVDWEPLYPVSENELLKIIAILRLAVPYTGMIISTRERPEVRAKAFEIGISQTSAASRTSPGGYGESLETASQFHLQDGRSLDEVVQSILEQKLLPSL